MGEYVYRQPLLTRKGKLATPGWTPEDLFIYNKENMPFSSRRREWEFYQVSDPRFAFRIGYGHGPGAGRAEAVLTDFETGEKVRTGKLTLLPGDSMDLDFAPGEPHGVKYEDDKLLLSLGFDGETRRVVVRSDRFDAQFTVRDAGDAMRRIASHYGVEEESFFVLSNGIMATGKNYARSQFIPIKGASLDKVVAVNQLSREVEQGRYTLEQLEHRLKGIRAMKAKPAWEQILASAVGSAAFCIIFGGSFMDCIA